MGEAVRLGRVRGIELRAHWSILIIGWLLVWALADNQFPTDAPKHDPVLYWFAAILTVCLFFAGLLAHEVAHSLVATRLGVAVDSITLWLFGGVSRLHGEARTPEAELRIAIAGPLTSLAIAAGFGLLALGVDVLDASPLIGAVVTWLAFMNALLAVFNLIPAAPLDGGRVLHALVWRRTSDRSRATVIATTAGRTFGYGLMGVGVVLLAAGRLGGMWFAFLGWFLVNAARAEATHVLIHDALAGVRVRDVMTPDPITAPADLTIRELLDELLLQHHCSAFPAVDATGAVLGLITLRQVKEIPRDRRDELRVREVASPRSAVPTATPDEMLATVLDRSLASSGGDGRILVFEGEGLVGIVSPTDVMRALEVAGLRSARR